MKLKRDDQKRIKQYLRFSSIAFQMGGVIVLGALGGKKLDEKQQNDFPIWTLVLVLIAIFSSLYLVIKEVIKLGKEDEQNKK